jgi:hypothetical protein
VLIGAINVDTPSGANAGSAYVIFGKANSFPAAIEATAVTTAPEVRLYEILRHLAGVQRAETHHAPVALVQPHQRSGCPYAFAQRR